MQLQSVKYDNQHDFAWVANEDDHSVVLALLPVNFYEKCNDQGLDPRGWPFSCLPDFKQIVVTAVITSCPPACTSSAGMLSTPADFPFFSDCTVAYSSLRRMGWSSSVSLWGQFSTDGFPLIQITKLSVTTNKNEIRYI